MAAVAAAAPRRANLTSSGPCRATSTSSTAVTTRPSGLWSDGETLWLLENGDGAADAIYAYDLASGERVPDREFELDERNRAPRGVWSDRTTIWVSDSGQEKLFAHNLETRERLEERDIALAARNSAARGIWSDGEAMWVLDGGTDSLFAYDLASGDLLGEYELASANGDPHGIFFDGVTFWVSDHVEKRLFAYRLEAGEDGADALERNRDEEFPGTVLSRASNNSPRGLWSDGGVMYVADESDARVYTYNMPDGIDARLASLSLSGVDLGEFSPNHEEYEGSADEGVSETTVTALAMQRLADVDIDPPDADVEAEGHQVALDDLREITVTVTSGDGSRTRVYRSAFEEAGPAPDCLRGAVAVGFSILIYEGGSVGDLVGCAESRHVTALYALEGGAYVPYILGAPEFVNRSFLELYAEGVPATTLVIAKSDGPATADPSRDDLAVQSWPECLRGENRLGLQPRPLRGWERRGARLVRAGPSRHGSLHPRGRRLRGVHPRGAGVREPVVLRAVRGRAPGRHAADRQERGVNQLIARSQAPASGADGLTGEIPAELGSRWVPSPAHRHSRGGDGLPHLRQRLRQLPACVRDLLVGGLSDPRDFSLRERPYHRSLARKSSSCSRRRRFSRAVMRR